MFAKIYHMLGHIMKSHCFKGVKSHWECSITKMVLNLESIIKDIWKVPKYLVFKQFTASYLNKKQLGQLENILKE